jgi:hypothetical protein
MSNRYHANDLRLHREDDDEWEATEKRSAISKILDPARELLRGLLDPMDRNLDRGSESPPSTG